MILGHPMTGCTTEEERIMDKRTCAACDCELDDSAIKVKLRGRTVEVCCDDCAKKLREADAFTKASPRAGA
jgi:hypothetical protein